MNINATMLTKPKLCAIPDSVAKKNTHRFVLKFRSKVINDHIHFKGDFFSLTHALFGIGLDLAQSGLSLQIRGINTISNRFAAIMQKENV